MQRGWRSDEWDGPRDNEARTAFFKAREGGRTVGAGQVTEIISAIDGGLGRPDWAAMPDSLTRVAELVS